MVPRALSDMSGRQRGCSSTGCVPSSSFSSPLLLLLPRPLDTPILPCHREDVHRAERSKECELGVLYSQPEYNRIHSALRTFALLRHLPFRLSPSHVIFSKPSPRHKIRPNTYLPLDTVIQQHHPLDPLGIRLADQFDLDLLPSLGLPSVRRSVGDNSFSSNQDIPSLCSPAVYNGPT
jgi:hypothetical protein